MIYIQLNKDNKGCKISTKYVINKQEINLVEASSTQQWLINNFSTNSKAETKSYCRDIVSLMAIENLLQPW